MGKVKRTYKGTNEVPPPTHYERKDVTQTHSIGSKDTLSKNPRVILCKIDKGKTKSFLDQAEANSKHLQGPGHYTPKQIRSDRMDDKILGAVSWERQMVKSK